eukprot:COSAG01_NODE_3272_length_6321_cov_12.850530_9_plen_90_part_01
MTHCYSHSTHCSWTAASPSIFRHLAVLFCPLDFLVVRGADLWPESTLADPGRGCLVRPRDRLASLEGFFSLEGFLPASMETADAAAWLDP